MDGARFDGFTRAIARRGTRRAVMQWIAGGLSGSLLAGLAPANRPSEALAQCHITSINVTFAAFIAADQSQTPGLQARPVSLGPLAGVALIQGPLTNCFATDNRSFDPSPTASSRFRASLEIDVQAGVIRSQPAPFSSKTMEVGCHAGSSSCQYGTLCCVATAQPRGGFSGFQVSPDGLTFTLAMTLAGANPCVTSVVSPEIDANGTLTIQVSPDRSTATVSFQGFIDQYPSFEMYASADLGVALPVFPPQSPLPGTSPSNLPGPANRPVSGSLTLRACDGRCAEGTCAGACCSDVCVHTESDMKHCGRCGHACATGERCVGGQCACGFQECGPGTTCCSGACPNLKTNSKHCGACGRACSGNDRCVGGQCVCGFIVCSPGSGCCNGACTDLATTTNCGACGRTCAEGERCVGGHCTCGFQTCTAGKICCGGTCLDPCPAPRVLNRTTCRCVCPPDRPNDCNGVCAACCINSDCRGGKICQNRTCVCPPDRPNDCNGVCAACCNNSHCRGGKVCRNGTCVCPGGTRECGGACVDIETDPAHCGGCGIRCGSDQHCDHGTCFCDAARCAGNCCDNICFAVCRPGETRDLNDCACKPSQPPTCTPRDCSQFASANVLTVFNPTRCACTCIGVASICTAPNGSVTVCAGGNCPGCIPVGLANWDCVTGEFLG